VIKLINKNFFIKLFNWKSEFAHILALFLQIVGVNR
jgi:hypothetical protein